MKLPIQSTGHAEFFDDQSGQWWLACLGVRHSQYPLSHHLGRETYIAPLNWDGDWPEVEGEFLQLRMNVPQALPAPSAPQTKVEWKDDFDSTELSLEWNFRRNPIPDSWSLTERPGSLSLKYCAATLDDVAPLAFVGRRQQHFECEVETVVDTSEQDNAEAGLCIMMNETPNTVHRTR